MIKHSPRRYRWIARIVQNRLALFGLLLLVQLQFFTINMLNARLRAPTDGWELQIALVDAHIRPEGLWLIPYTIGFMAALLVPLWGMLVMPTKLYRQFIMSMGLAALFSYVVYIFVPTYVTKPNPDEVRGYWVFADLLRSSYEADAAASTHNAAPSQHVFYAILNMCFVIRFRPRPGVFWLWVTLATLISASTLMTQRHNSPDLIAGYVVAVGAYYAGIYLGDRVTAWLGDEHGPVRLPAWVRLPRRAARNTPVPPREA